MRFFTDTERYVPIFNGAIERCRAIDDHFIVFDRAGNIIFTRTCEPKLRECKNFFELTSESDADGIISLCTSFELRHLVLDTALGGAVVFTELFGISGLLFAVIPLAGKEWVFEYFNQESCRHATLLGSAASYAVPRCNEGELKRAKSAIEAADGAISCAEITAARYGFGASIGKYLAERILAIADFIGCVGKSSTELEILPNLSNFSAEIFNLFTLLTVAFAREYGEDRNFKATVGETEGHLWVSFCIGVGEDFTLYRNGALRHGILAFCEDLASSRDTVFDLSHRKESNSLIISFAPESDRFINRVIKQSIRDMIKDFWENAL